MIKHILLATAAIALSITSGNAQNEEYHVFTKNANNFTSIKGVNVQKITHRGTLYDGFTNLLFNNADGSTTSFEISQIDSVKVTATGIPEFHVNLQDYPEWSELQGAKDDIHPATLRMDGLGSYSDVVEQTVEFRGRGNSTWGMKKKPYRFKLAKKASVCGLPKAKSFALIANYIDCTLMRNAIALWTANYLEMPFANHCVPVRVYLNNIYKGAYMLTEKIGIGGGSVDIDEYKGMLFELDSNYDEDFRFFINLSNLSTITGGNAQSNTNYLPVMVKDPDLTEICDSLGVTTTDYFNTWKTDFTNMVKAVMSSSTPGNLSDYIDIDQAVNFFIVNALASNHEMKHPKSLYIHKESLETGEVYKFGPVWDFDWAFTFDGYEGASASAPLISSNGDNGGYKFLKALFQNQEFRAAYKAKWDDFVTNGYPKLRAYMEEYANLIEPTAIENGQLWPADYSISWRRSESSLEFRKNLAALKTWLDQRIAYCNSNANYGLY